MKLSTLALTALTITLAAVACDRHLRYEILQGISKHDHRHNTSNATEHHQKKGLHTQPN